MCSHANITSVLPEQHPTIQASEKAHSPTSSIDEKGKLSLIPDPTLACLSPTFKPMHLQKIIRESILLSTGALAILLQVSLPGVGSGVNQHSNFAYRPIDRLRTTMTYVYCMGFGTPSEKSTIISMVHKAHQPVKGEGYDANDEDLQLWVAATLYVCGVDVYEKVFGKLGEEEAELVFQDYSVMAESLRVPPGKWPKTRKEFWAYWDEKVNTLQVNEDAKAVGKDLLFNKNGPIWLKLSLPLLRTLTVQWLPPRLREEFGLRNSKGKERVYRISLGLVRRFYPHLPTGVREYPLRHYLKDMRKRMRDNEKVI